MDFSIFSTHSVIFIFGTAACQIYCYGRYCVRRSVSPQVPENPSGPLVDNFIVLHCVAFGVPCVKLLPGVDRWNSLDDPRVITSTPYMALPLFATRFAAYAGGHPSLFHTATSLLIWYKMFCMRDISYRLTWMKFLNMLSVYAQSGTHRHVNWLIIAVLT